MKRFPALAALAALTLAACGSSDDGSPTAEENEQLDSIANELDVTDASPDSLTTEDAALGNGESAETGDVLVAEGNEAAVNAQ
jgi:hypothetical protein